MMDLVLYVRRGPVKCSGCEAAKDKLTAAKIAFDERDGANIEGDALRDSAVRDALHAYWWHNNEFPKMLPVLVSRTLREVWDADDLEGMEFKKEVPCD